MVWAEMAARLGERSLYSFSGGVRRGVFLGQREQD
jgi:hypothetical protein